MHHATPPVGTPPRTWPFLLLLLALSIPFYVLGLAGDRLPFATFLPLSALMTFTPMLAALGLAWRCSGARGAMDLLGRAFDVRRVRDARWVLAALLLMPVVFLLAYGVQGLSGGARPDPAVFPASAVLAFSLMFFLGAIGEELGWQGHAFAGLRAGRSVFAASLVLGVIWALWHVIPFALMGRSAAWILLHGLCMVALRVLLVWLFVNAGESVFIAALFHATTNGAWGLITNYGSFYDPFAMLLVLAPLTGAIVALWGPSTLARFRFARPAAKPLAS